MTPVGDGSGRVQAEGGPPGASAGPLHGVRVLDLTRLLPGGLCTMMLADLGADVAKVEHPDRGDEMRWAADRVGSQSAVFHAVGRNKRSVALDLKSDAGAAAVQALAAAADVVVESFRPGAAARLGVDAATLRGRHPGLVHCSISGFGQHGPLRDRPGHDIGYLARSGVLSLLGEPGEAALPTFPLSDLAAGQTAAFAIVSGLFARRLRGEGASIDVSMTDVAFQWLGEFAVSALAHGREPKRACYHWTGGSGGYNVYETSDGKHLVLGIEEPKFWRRFCEIVGRPDLEGRDPLAVGESGAALRAEVAAVIASRTRAAWEAAFGADVPCEPVLSVREALRSPHAGARGLVGATESVDGRPLEVPVLPLGWPAVDGRIRRRPPRLGEHTNEVLVEWTGAVHA